MNRESLESLGRLLTRVVAAVIGTFVLLAYAPAFARPWIDSGTLRYTLKEKVVIALAPNGPAARAGIKIGDRVASLDPPQFAPGTAVTVRLVRAGRPMAVTLVAAAGAPWTAIESLVLILTVSLAFAGVAGAIALALQRPSWATAFLVLASLNLPVAIDVYFYWGRFVPTRAAVELQTFCDIVFAGIPIWFFVLFAIAFGQERWTRLRVAAAVLVGGVIVAVLQLEPTASAGLVSATIVYLPSALAFVSLAFSYAKAAPRDRRRLAWLMVAVTIQLVSFVAFQMALDLGIAGPHLLVLRSIETIGSVAWLGVLYAVWRRNVVDVGFALNKSIVVTLLTGVLLGAVGLARWIGDHALAASGLTAVLEVLATVVFGYVLNALNRRTEATIERFVFRTRYAAEQRVKRNIAALPFAATPGNVAEALIDDTVSDLRLASAALFVARGDGFVRVRAEGWPDSTAMHIADDDRIVRYLRAEMKPMVLRELGWHRDDVPQGDARAAYLFPLAWRGRLIGFAAYGQHRDGSALDPQELALLGNVVDAGAIAYVTVELDELRRRVGLGDGATFTSLTDVTLRSALP